MIYTIYKDPETAETFSESKARERFDDFVNETHDTITILGMNFDPARLLRDADPIAYREEFLGFLDTFGIEVIETENFDEWWETIK